MSNYLEQHANYQRIAKAIHYLIAHQQTQPQLNELAQHLTISEFHLQRLFSEWAGVSPKQFLQFLTKEHAKQMLKNNSVLDAALSSGLSGSGRLHDLLISSESVTPGEYRRSGEGLTISYGTHPSPFGYCFIASTHRGICKISFFDAKISKKTIVDELQAEWVNAEIIENQDKTKKLFENIFLPNNDKRELKIVLKGSPFQLKVWEALLKIPQGQIKSYQQVAEQLGSPSSVRAVASAIAKNNIALLIPCHRVIRATGVLNNYRWGDARKAAMICWESSRFLAPH